MGIRHIWRRSALIWIDGKGGTAVIDLKPNMKLASAEIVRENPGLEQRNRDFVGYKEVWQIWAGRSVAATIVGV